MGVDGPPIGPVSVLLSETKAEAALLPSLLSGFVKQKYNLNLGEHVGVWKEMIPFVNFSVVATRSSLLNMEPQSFLSNLSSGAPTGRLPGPTHNLSLSVFLVCFLSKTKQALNGPHKSSNGL